MMGHHTPYIHGVVKSKCHHEDDYDVSWEICVTPNMDNNKVFKINAQGKHTIYLTLVRDKADSNEEDDEYVN